VERYYLTDPSYWRVPGYTMRLCLLRGSDWAVEASRALKPGGLLVDEQNREVLIRVGVSLPDVPTAAEITDAICKDSTLKGNPLRVDMAARMYLGQACAKVLAERGKDYHGTVLFAPECDVMLELEGILGNPVPKVYWEGEILSDAFKGSGYLTESGHVMVLALRKQGLTSLPEEIGNLKSLQELKLGGNRITSLPESIVQLRSLKILDLAGNPLPGLPESMGQFFTQLQKFSFGEGRHGASGKNMVGLLGDAGGDNAHSPLLNILRVFVRYVEEGRVAELEPNLSCTIVKIDFTGGGMRDRICLNQVVFRDENTLENHALYAHCGLERAEIKMGIITISRIARRIVVFFDLTRDLAPQLKLFRDLRFFPKSIAAYLTQFDLLDPARAAETVRTYQETIEVFFAKKGISVSACYPACTGPGEEYSAYNDAVVNLLLDLTVRQP